MGQQPCRFSWMGLMVPWPRGEASIGAHVGGHTRLWGSEVHAWGYARMRGEAATCTGSARMRREHAQGGAHALHLGGLHVLWALGPDTAICPSLWHIMTLRSERYPDNGLYKPHSVNVCSILKTTIILQEKKKRPHSIKQW